MNDTDLRDSIRWTGDMIVRRWDDVVADKVRIEAENVQSEQGFAIELLREADGRYLSYDGQRIVLDVDNGRWVWEVTGTSPDGRIVYGRWPD